MAINCFENYITLARICSPTTPASGLYFNNHPDVSLKKLERITTEELGSLQQLYNEIYSRALVEFENDIQVRATKRFRRVAVVSNIVSHEYDDPLVATTVGAEYRGVYIEVSGSQFYDVAINSIRLYSSGTQSTTLYIFDANTGQQLDTVAISATQGYNFTQVNKVYTVPGETKRLFVAYDATAFASAETSRLYLSDYGCDCRCNVPFREIHDVIECKGAKISTSSNVIESNLTKQGDSEGLVVNFNVICGIGNLICQHRELFKVAFWYRLAVEFWREIEASDRINAFTLRNDRDEAIRKLNGDEAMGIVSLYDVYADKLQKAIDQLPDGDGYCFECDGGIELNYLIP